MIYTKGDVIAGEDNKKYQCIVADEDTACFGKLTRLQSGGTSVKFNDIFCLTNLESFREMNESNFELSKPKGVLTL